MNYITGILNNRKLKNKAETGELNMVAQHSALG